MTRHLRLVPGFVLLVVALCLFPTLARAQTYTLTLVTNGTGTISLSPPGGSYASNTTVTATATAAAGWVFTGWSGVKSTTNNPVSFKITTNESLTATFAQLAAIDQPPTNISAYLGDTVTFTMHAVGTQPLHYQWLFNGVVQPSSTNTLTLTDVQTNQAGTYWVVVSNAYGVASNSAVLSITNAYYTLTTVTNGMGTISLDPPTGPYLSNSTVTATATTAGGWVFTGWSGAASGTNNPVSITMATNESVTATFVWPPTIDQPPQNIVANGGDTVTFSMHAVGASPLYYEWLFNGVVQDSSTNSLTLTDVQTNQSGTYWVVVSNAYGVTSNSAILNVTNTYFALSTATNGMGTIILNPPPGPYLSNSTVTATETPAAGWVFAGWSGAVTGTNNPVSITMDTNEMLTAVFVEPPSIVQPPQNVSAVAGEIVPFAIDAIGTSPLSYQWLFRGVAQPSTSNSLTLTDVQTNQAGTYWVVVSNAYGVASNSATLTVTNVYSLTIVTNGMGTVSLNLAVPPGGPLTSSFETVTDGIYQCNYTNPAVQLEGWTVTNNVVELQTTNGPTLLTNDEVGVVAVSPYDPNGVTNVGSDYLGTNYLALTSGRIVQTFSNLTPGVVYQLKYYARGSGITHWWPADDTTNDLIGGDPATIPSSGVTYDVGEVNEAFSFGGANPNSQTGNVVNFGASAGNFGTNDFTIDFWIKQPAGNPNLYAVLEKKPGCNGGNPAWDIEVGPQTAWGLKSPPAAAGRMDFDIIEPPSNPAGPPVVSHFISFQQIDDGIFHHVAFTRQGLTLSDYIDGTLDATTTSPGIFNLVNSASTIAGQSVCVGTEEVQFQGDLDELDFYNRGLSPAEVYAIYHAGSLGKYSTNSILPNFTVSIDGISANNFILAASGEWQAFTNYFVPGTNQVTVEFSGNALGVLLDDLQFSQENPVNPAGPYPCNTVVDAAATPDPGWVFADWSGVGSGTNDPLSVTVVTNETLIATFAELPMIDSAPQNEAAKIGGAATFSVDAVGTPPLFYQWLFNGVAQDSTTNVLTLTDLQTNQAGSYWVVVSNAYGVTSNSAILFVSSGTNVVLSNTQAALQQAINIGGVVTFGISGTITLTNTINITNNLVLDATGLSVAISGGNAVQIMTIATNTTVVLSNITFIEGAATGLLAHSNELDYALPACGGAISNAGMLEAFSCTFTSNSAVGYDAAPLSEYFDGVSGGAGFGGALYNSGVLAAQNCFFTSNSANGGEGASDPYLTASDAPEGGSGMGGAIYNAGQATIVSSSLLDNYANGASGPSEAGPYYFSQPQNVGGQGGAATGGAIFSSNTLIVSNVTFALDAAVGGPGGSGGTETGFEGAPGYGGGGGGGANGGGICCGGGSATIAGCAFWSNSVTGGGGGVGGPGMYGYFDSGDSGGVGGAGGAGGLGDGGAVCTFDGTNGIVNCTFWSNSAAGGAGSVGGQGGEAGGGRGTIAGNGGNGGQGGNGSGGAIGVLGGYLTMTNLTIASNFVTGGVGGAGGQPGVDGYPSIAGSPGANGTVGAVQGSALANAGGTSLLLNSILSANILTDTNIFGPLIDAGYNISFDGQLSLTNPTSMNGVNPLLGPLAWNGGPTETMALLAGSPAIDAADPSAFPPIDQRGFPRPWGSGPDIGAFEYSSPNVLMIGAHGAGSLSLAYAGTNGQTYEIQISTDLMHWTSIQTNVIGPNGYSAVAVPVTNAQQFFRAVSP